MLAVLSPAKRLDWADRPDITQTQPDMLTEANRLVKTARTLTAEDLSRLMDISADLGKLNATRFKTYKQRGIADTRPAAFAFAGDTYQGLEAQSLSEDALRWADGNLRILSGLYGLLRPTDAIQPYRLEMGTRLVTERGKTLYAYWGDRISKGLNKTAKAAETDILVNCASQEYFTAVDRKALKLRVITPVFLEDQNGTAKTISFFAKRARGAMAGWIVRERITAAKALVEFAELGYRYDPGRSTPDRPVFIRRNDG